ncbi:MAG: hypothetical protein ACXWUF_11820, partial [Methylomagnum sp.]
LETACWLVKTVGLTEWRGWFEPFPGLRPDGRPGRADFSPWTNHWPDPAKTPELAEIRIGGYLPDNRLGGCHLVQDDDGAVRWFAFAERRFDGAVIKQVEKIPAYRVLQRQDAERRFFSKGHVPDWLKKQEKSGRLELVEYWRGDTLLAWLVVDANKGVKP